MEISHLPNWSQSALNHSIELFSSHPLEELCSLKPYIFIGGVHGDEPEGVLLAEALLDWVKTINCEANNIHPFVLIPCLNVDGYGLNQRMNGQQVDLNRNYPSSGWQESKNKDRYYAGPSAGSEPEIIAMVNLIQTLQPKVIFHFHSWKPCVVLTGPEDLPEANHLAESSGYEIVKSIGYDTPGSLSEYGWIDNGVPIICIEEVEKIHEAKEILWARWSKAFHNILMR